MSGRTLQVRNPFTGKPLETLELATRERLRTVLDEALEAFTRWRGSSSYVRSELLTDAADRLEARRREFAELMRDEAGKPIALAEVEVTRCLGVLRWAAAEAQRFSGELLRIDTSASGRTGFGIAGRFPRGVVLGITPFNFPLNLVAHKVAPAVAAGCPIVIKPSPATPMTAIRFSELFKECGAPTGLVQVALADDEATATLTRAPEIAMVSFTGSARVGKLVRAQACDKPVTLELGGNAWVIVMDDIAPDLFPAIAKRISGAAFGYAGQSCISVQNVAAPPEHLPELRRTLAASTENVVFGDPSDPKVISGPVINEAAARRIRHEIESVPRRFEVVRSGQYRGTQGEASRSLVVDPTMIAIPDDFSDFERSSLIQEEIFGPVMTVARFEGIDDIVARVNSSRYGLQAGVFTRDFAAIEKLYRELRVGGLVVNDVPTTRYDHQPYGGVKDSGQGREGVRYAMEEMTEAKFLALSSEIPG